MSSTTVSKKQTASAQIFLPNSLQAPHGKTSCTARAGNMPPAAKSHVALRDRTYKTHLAQARDRGAAPARAGSRVGQDAGIAGDYGLDRLERKYQPLVDAASMAR